MVVATSSAVLSALPSFLVGSLAVLIREDLDFGQTELGLAVATYFLFSAGAAIPGGHLTERIGARAAMLIGAAATGAAMLGIALVASSWAGLLMWMVLAGAANGLAQPAGNLALARGVARARQGFAFGLKQAAIPAATLVAGAAVPLVGLTLGWRWAFAGAAAGAVLVAAIMPADRYVSPRKGKGQRLREGDAPMLGLAVLAVAAACAAAAGTSLAAFYVETAVDAGIAPGPAGTLLVLGSTVGIGCRLWLGRLADRREQGHLTVVAVAIGFGALGFVALAFSAWLPALLFGTVVGFGAGWGWPGLFNFAVVRLNRNAPAAATAVTQTGIYVGGVVGPAAFGAVAGNASFTAAWAMATILNIAGGGFLLAGRRLLRGQASTPAA